MYFINAIINVIMTMYESLLFQMIPLSSSSLHQDVPCGFDVGPRPVTSTRVGDASRTLAACTKSNSRVTGFAIVFVVPQDPNSAFLVDVTGTTNIETFHVTVGL